MFRPHLAKMICDAKDGEYVLDPCAGWGGRMLGAVASGKGYVGFEPNDETYNNLNELVNYLKLSNVILYNDVAENMNKYDFPNPDIILTSPPYYNLEIYSDKGSENDYDNYESWRDYWLKDVILKSLGHLNRGGWSCWNVHNIGKMKLIDDVRDIHERNSFNEVREFGLQSSKRQSNGCQKTNLDVTKVYQS
jgi:tRNA1(Val) A37 N6-methylase TrmN6